MLKFIIFLNILFSSAFAQNSLKEITEKLNKNKESLTNLNEQYSVLMKKNQLRKEKMENIDSKSKQMRNNINSHNENNNKAKENLKLNLNAELKATRLKLKNLKTFGGEIKRLRYRKYLRCLRNEERIKNEISDVFTACSSKKEKAIKYNGKSSSLWKEITQLEKENKDTLSAKQNKLKVLKAQGRKLELKHHSTIVESRVISNSRDFVSKKIDSLTELYENKVFEKKYSNYLKCSPQTQTVDLEAVTPKENKTPGTLSNITQDNQDGLGTCYANTAKNILAGLSRGKVDASFLDMALQYKVGMNSVSGVDNLDSGESCFALKQIKKMGYCPKKFSPIESGEDIFKDQGLLSKYGGIQGQAVVLGLLDDYLKGKNALKNDQSEFAKAMLSNSKKIIEALKVDRNIVLSFPQISGNPLSKAKNFELNYKWQYLQKLKPGEKAVSLKKFKEDFSKIEIDFKKTMIENLKKGATFQQQKDTFNSHFSSYIKKYHLEEKMLTPYSTSELDRFIRNNSDSQIYKEQTQATLKLYKSILGNKITQEAIEKQLDPTCTKNADSYLSFFKGLNELTRLGQYISETSLNKFYDSEADLEAKEILQLAVAPKCLDSKNRVPLDFDFSCKNTNYGANYSEDQKRRDIMKQLVLGIPVGRTHANNMGGFHIHSIVGYRYDPESKSCSYKIRESQSGYSYWKSEKSVFKETLHFTIVKRIEK